MSDSESKTLKELTDEAVAAVAADVKQTIEAGRPLIAGAASVQLVARIPDASTPEDAVEILMRDVARNGMGNLTFVVIDTETGDEYYVRGGRLYSLEELRGTLRAVGDEQG